MKTVYFLFIFSITKGGSRRPEKSQNLLKMMPMACLVEKSVGVIIIILLCISASECDNG